MPYIMMKIENDKHCEEQIICACVRMISMRQIRQNDSNTSLMIPLLDTKDAFVIKNST